MMVVSTYAPMHFSTAQVGNPVGDHLFGLVILAFLALSVGAGIWRRKRNERRWAGIKKDRRNHWGAE